MEKQQQQHQCTKWLLIWKYKMCVTVSSTTSLLYFTYFLFSTVVISPLYLCLLVLSPLCTPFILLSLCQSSSVLHKAFTNLIHPSIHPPFHPSFHLLLACLHPIPAAFHLSFIYLQYCTSPICFIHSCIHSIIFILNVMLIGTIDKP